MRLHPNTIPTILFLVFCQLTIPSFGQLGISFDIKKPKQYDTRVLRSEKSDQKKFNLPRRFIQNTVTHYNYYFNANNKLNEVIEKAKASFTDDYEKLLPFYNYSLETTSQDKLELDSISYKSQTGIALHDLRNDWVDNLYLLWGAAYYLRKDFDSAYLMFQFINYAFAEKEKDGYYKTIGSSRDGNAAFSISTKEKTSLPRKIFAEPPSRNDAFIWQIRNFLAQDLFTEAASLIVTLKNDPVFPKRLQNDLQEVQAYWFYKQNMWDSSVVHLIQALDNATTPLEKARWEYLIAQMYEMTGKYKESENYYAKVSNHTTDPVMDIYARLFSIRVNKDGGENYIEKNIAELVKMAKRDKYEDYRDIIYYMAAQMELERNNVDGALALLQKSTQYHSDNTIQRNKAFIQLAELSFNKKKYRQAYNFYDSIRLDEPTLKNADSLTQRKEMLGRIARNIEIIERQDSLQHIAALPEAERKDFIKKLVRQLRKQQGLKGEGITTGSPFTQQPVTTLFPSADQKGEWYFYNPASSSRGANEFKTKWGNRPNVDNWRRSASVSGTLQAKINNANNINQSSGSGTKQDEGSNEITFDGLFDKLPLTPEAIKKSNDSIQSALYPLGKIYIQEVEDCTAGTETYESLRNRFPQFEKMDEVLFNLYYCYNKNGETAEAAAIKKLMGEKYSVSNFNTIITTGKNPASTTANTDATKTYEKVYDLFVEGSFEQAITLKNKADSLYSHNYWIPQLLYIEAVYYIKQRDDSTAKKVLNNITSQFAGTVLAAKATTLLDVLGRRKQIEDELRNLNITRYEEEKINRVHEQIRKDTGAVVVPPPIVINNKPIVDSVSKKPVAIIQIPVSTYSFTPLTPHYAVVLLNKIDPVFCNEAKNAFVIYNKETFYNKQMGAELVTLDADNRILLLSPFKTAAEAVEYVDKIRPKTATEIIPWLKGGKYTFSIISEKNLDILKSVKDLENYKTFLNQNLPGMF